MNSLLVYALGAFLGTLIGSTLGKVITAKIFKEDKVNNATDHKDHISYRQD